MIDRDAARAQRARAISDLLRVRAARTIEAAHCRGAAARGGSRVQARRFVMIAAMLLCLMVAAANVAAADIYVSPSGSDTRGDGTQAKPFATLPKAQLAARKALAAAAGAGD